MTNLPFPSMDRRSALAAIGLSGLGASLFAQSPRAGDAPLAHDSLGWNASKGEYELPPLPYAFDALEPHIDARTMELHHDKHHAGYVRGLNNALKKLGEAREAQDDALIQHWTRELAFHGSGHVNHAVFWRVMAPPDQGGGGRASGRLAEAIDRDFASFERFAWQFKKAAGSVEGSGWAWLEYEPIAARLLITQREKHQNLSINGTFPLLGIDVWEHAYYLKYQNRRGEYVDAFMNVINWPFIATLYDHATAMAPGVDGATRNRPR